MPTITELRHRIGSGSTSATEVVEGIFSKLARKANDESSAFRETFEPEALARADRLDRVTSKGIGPLHGIPISVKDNIDTAGATTAAGSRVLAANVPAKVDADAVQNIKRAGAIVVGKTNMSELAFSGVGLNPHFGTPLNPFDRSERRMPGGSSSGAAVSVAEGLSAAAIGTDTGGSIRIPAALCGLVGFKPTQQSISRTGVLPLSNQLDCVGTIARSVEDCFIVHVVLSNLVGSIEPKEPKSIRLWHPGRSFLDGIDDEVAAAFECALQAFHREGVEVVQKDMRLLDGIADINSRGPFAAYEAWKAFRAIVEHDSDRMDPRIAERIKRGSAISDVAFQTNVRERNRMIEHFATKLKDVDAIVCPTVPIVAPRIAELQQPDRFGTVNLLLLRNPTAENILDAPSISLPRHAEGKAPVGLMMIGKRAQDAALFNVAYTIEMILNAARRRLGDIRA